MCESWIRLNQTILCLTMALIDWLGLWNIPVILPGSVISSTNSRSHGQMEFEDFCQALMQSAPIEKAKLFMQQGRLWPCKNPQIQLYHVTGCYKNLAHSHPRFHGIFTDLTRANNNMVTFHTLLHCFIIMHCYFFANQVTSMPQNSHFKGDFNFSICKA